MAITTLNRLRGQCLIGVEELNLVDHRNMTSNSKAWHNRAGFFHDLPLAYFRSHSLSFRYIHPDQLGEELRVLKLFLRAATKPIKGEVEYSIAEMRKKENLIWRKKGGSLDVVMDSVDEGL